MLVIYPVLFSLAIALIRKYEMSLKLATLAPPGWHDQRPMLDVWRYDPITATIGYSVRLTADGKWLYWADAGGVWNIELAIAWDLTSHIGSEVEKVVTPSTQGMTIKPDGTRFWVVADSGDKVIQYTMNTPNDLSDTTTDGEYTN